MKFLNFLIRSSENPNNLSMTVKGTLGSVISVVLLLAPIFHFTADQTQLNAIVDGLIQVILGIAAVVSAVATVIGLVRKIALSGTNPVELQTTPLPTKIGDSPQEVVIVPPVE